MLVRNEFERDLTIVPTSHVMAFIIEPPQSTYTRFLSNIMKMGDRAPVAHSVHSTANKPTVLGTDELT